VKVVAKLSSELFPGEEIAYSLAVGWNDVGYWRCSQ